MALQPLRNECEIIIVDGNSSDHTLDTASTLVDKILTSGKGRARQMNAGAKQAKGDMLIFLHADTLLPDPSLSLISQTLKQTENSWGRFDIQLSGKPIMLKVIATFMNWRSRLTSIATGDQAVFVSKQLFAEVGGYADIALMEDINLCAKLKKTSPPICLNAKVTSSSRRWERFGIMKTILLMWSLRLRYFFGENPDTLSTLYSKGLFWKP